MQMRQDLKFFLFEKSQVNTSSRQCILENTQQLIEDERYLSGLTLTYNKGRN